MQAWFKKHGFDISLWGASAVFHPTSRSIYFVSGYRLQKEMRVVRYSVDSDLWYYIGKNPANSTSSTSYYENQQDTRIFPSAVLFDNDLIAVVGGQTIGDEGVQESLNQCFTSTIQVFDIGKKYHSSFFNVLML